MGIWVASIFIFQIKRAPLKTNMEPIKGSIWKKGTRLQTTNFSGVLFILTPRHRYLPQHLDPIPPERWACDTTEHRHWT